MQVHLTSVLGDDFPKTIANLIGYSNDLVANNPDYCERLCIPARAPHPRPA